MKRKAKSDTVASQRTKLLAEFDAITATIDRNNLKVQRASQTAAKVRERAGNAYLKAVAAADKAREAAYAAASEAQTVAVAAVEKKNIATQTAVDTDNTRLKRRARFLRNEVGVEIGALNHRVHPRPGTHTGRFSSGSRGPSSIGPTIHCDIETRLRELGGSI